MGISQDLIDRINELSRKSKTPEGLNAEERAEQAILRKAYIEAFRGNLKSQLDSISIVDKDGNVTPLKKKDNEIIH